ncbi:LCP family protein [Alkalicoccus chagannorensis]|uniref:LCP family protein n=1 Tax=Alkalicoccus chagannorensis TaxID=427072 RepID=UPI000413150A|nr:LCP family protein [Alkalicoccus chagannorensis]
MGKTKKALPLWLKFLTLTVLIFVLGGVGFAAWAVNEFDNAREASIEEIEREGGTVDNNEDIEFDAADPEEDEEEELDHINLLLIGVGDDSDEGRTDTILIGQYHPEDGELKLASMMRDMYVDIPGRGSNKLNAAYAYGGLELLRETIDENFEFPLHYYAQVNFDGFTQIVDVLAPDGIEVEVEEDMYYEDEAGGLLIDFEEGEHVLDGDEALEFVRFRNDGNNDFGRVQRQQEMLSNLQDELMTLSGVSRVPQLLGSMEPFFQTNMSNQQLISYTRDFFLHGDEDIETITIPAEGGYDYNYHSHAGSVLEPDFEANIEVLADFFEAEGTSASESAEEESASIYHRMPHAGRE